MALSLFRLFKSPMYQVINYVNNMELSFVVL
uniref:Uncharacterized protein n=1 Tax=Rhizophora mucronata TaxID=61149 RepID=A0A2P2MY60_RHIMU